MAKKKWNFKDSYYVGDTVYDHDFMEYALVVKVTRNRLTVKTVNSTREYMEPLSMPEFIREVEVVGNISYTLSKKKKEA